MYQRTVVPILDAKKQLQIALKLLIKIFKRFS